MRNAECGMWNDEWAYGFWQLQTSTQSVIAVPHSRNEETAISYIEGEASSCLFWWPIFYLEILNC